MKYSQENNDQRQDPEDEPVFLLRGHDPASIRTLEFYADEAERLGAGEDLLARVNEQAKRMYRWQKDHPVIVITPKL